MEQKNQRNEVRRLHEVGALLRRSRLDPIQHVTIIVQLNRKMKIFMQKIFFIKEVIDFTLSARKAPAKLGRASPCLVRRFHLDNSRSSVETVETGSLLKNQRNEVQTTSRGLKDPTHHVTLVPRANFERVQQVEHIRYSSSIFSPTSVNRFLNFLTKKGKKSKARLLLNKTLFLLTKKSLDSTKGKSNVQSNDPLNPIGIIQGVVRGQNPEQDSIFILNQAISNVKPFFEVKKVRVAGTTYQVPCLVQATRQESLAIHWILESAYERKKKNPAQPFENCLAFEIYEAFQKQGQARMKRNELHKLAEVNRAFSHFRWW